MDKQTIFIKLADTDAEFHQSAMLLSQNEPWVSLGRSYGYTMGKIRNAGSDLYIVYLNDKLAGCILIELHGTLKGFIRSFCINPEFQGKNIGSQVLSYIEKLIFESYPNVFVFAASFNTGAIRFYERNGYERIGIFKNYITEGSDEILFRKTIGASNHFQKKHAKVSI